MAMTYTLQFQINGEWKDAEDKLEMSFSGDDRRTKNDRRHWRDRRKVERRKTADHTPLFPTIL